MWILFISASKKMPHTSITSRRRRVFVNKALALNGPLIRGKNIQNRAAETRERESFSFPFMRARSFFFPHRIWKERMVRLFVSYAWRHATATGYRRRTNNFHFNQIMKKWFIHLVVITAVNAFRKYIQTNKANTTSGHENVIFNKIKPKKKKGSCCCC